MASKGQTDVYFDNVYFDKIMRSAGIRKLSDDTADRALAIAKATAPVDSGDYRDKLMVEHHDSRYRQTARVVGTDPKTLLVEAKTGNLARALKAAKQ